MGKLTKEELEILANAPEGAEFYSPVRECHYASYFNGDQSEVFVINGLNRWVDAGATDKAYCIRLAMPRKVKEDKQAKIVDAVNKTQSEGVPHIGAHLYYSSGDAIWKKGKLICTVNEFNQRVKEMSACDGELKFFEYSNAKKLKLDPVGWPLEWVNGDECYISNNQGAGVRVSSEVFIDKNCVVMSTFTAPNGIECAAVYHEGHGCEVFITSMLSKPLTAKEKAAKEMRKNVSAIMKAWGHESYEYEECHPISLTYAVVRQMLKDGYTK